MAYKMCAAFIVFLGMSLTPASSKSFGGSGPANGGRSASTHSTSHRSVARSRQRRHVRDGGAFWPGAGSYVYEPSNGEHNVDVTQPISGDAHYTCTHDIPWDWVHRCPPFVSHPKPPAPVVMPHVAGCATQTVTAPMADAKDQTVSIVRCY